MSTIADGSSSFHVVSARLVAMEMSQLELRSMLDVTSRLPDLANQTRSTNGRDIRLDAVAMRSRASIRRQSDALIALPLTGNS